MKTKNIGGFKLGIDMKSDETDMPKGTVRDAVNIDLTLGGGIRRRRGAARLATFSGAHSLWSAASGAFGLFAQYDALRYLTMRGDAPTVKTLLTGLAATGHMAFCEHGAEAIFTNGVDIGRIAVNGTARLLGVSDPAGAPAVVAGAGGLLAGRYGAAYSFVNAAGDESGLSPAAFIELDATGGISFTLPPAPDDVVATRLYTTPVNGEVFYQMAEVPLGLATYSVTDDTPGKMTDTQFLQRMPGGDYVRVFRGRLMVARGSVLAFSEPFNFGLTSARHNFVQFTSDITMLEAVEGGVYVGTDTAVYFLAGTGPGDFVQQAASTNAPAPGASSVLAAAKLPDEFERSGDTPVALWLGRIGYSIGMSDGTVHDVQSDRIDLPTYDGGAVVTYTKNGLTQVVSIVQSEQSNGAGSAIDSSL